MEVDVDSAEESDDGDVVWRHMDADSSVSVTSVSADLRHAIDLLRAVPCSAAGADHRPSRGISLPPHQRHTDQRHHHHHQHQRHNYHVRQCSSLTDQPLHHTTGQVKQTTL